MNGGKTMKSHFRDCIPYDECDKPLDPECTYIGECCVDHYGFGLVEYVLHKKGE